MLFRETVAEIRAILWFYATQNHNSVPTSSHYHSTLREMPEGRKFHLHRGGTLKSQNNLCLFEEKSGPV